MNISFERTTLADADVLADIRVQAMRTSLENIGRFDLHRARARFLQSFDPECCRFIIVRKRRIGLLLVRRDSKHLLIDHFYILPEAQGRGVGSAVLQTVIDDAEMLALPILLGALRGSDANRFYQRHGFVKSGESDVDVYYVRRPSAVRGGLAPEHALARVSEAKPPDSVQIEGAIPTFLTI